MQKKDYKSPFRRSTKQNNQKLSFRMQTRRSLLTDKLIMKRKLKFGPSSKSKIILSDSQSAFSLFTKEVNFLMPPLNRQIISSEKKESVENLEKICTNVTNSFPNYIDENNNIVNPSSLSEDTHNVSTNSHLTSKNKSPMVKIYKDGINLHLKGFRQPLFEKSLRNYAQIEISDEDIPLLTRLKNKSFENYHLNKSNSNSQDYDISKFDLDSNLPIDTPKVYKLKSNNPVLNIKRLNKNLLPLNSCNKCVMKTKSPYNCRTSKRTRVKFFIKGKINCKSKNENMLETLYLNQECKAQSHENITELGIPNKLKTNAYNTPIQNDDKLKASSEKTLRIESHKLFGIRNSFGCSEFESVRKTDLQSSSFHKKHDLLQPCLTLQNGLKEKFGTFTGIHNFNKHNYRSACNEDTYVRTHNLKTMFVTSDDYRLFRTSETPKEACKLNGIKVNGRDNNMMRNEVISSEMKAICKSMESIPIAFIMWDKIESDTDKFDNSFHLIPVFKHFQSFSNDKTKNQNDNIIFEMLSIMISKVSINKDIDKCSNAIKRPISIDKAENRVLNLQQDQSSELLEPQIKQQKRESLTNTTTVSTLNQSIKKIPDLKTKDSKPPKSLLTKRNLNAVADNDLKDFVNEKSNTMKGRTTNKINDKELKFKSVNSNLLNIPKGVTLFTKSNSKNKRKKIRRGQLESVKIFRKKHKFLWK